MSLNAVMEHLEEMHKDPTPPTPVEQAGLVETLKQRHQTFLATNDFKPGDIVQWKPGMRHKRSHGPFVVAEVFDEPVFGVGESSRSAYFREPLDLVLGAIDKDGDFVLFHHDSRRFEPYNGETIDSL